MGDMTSSLKCAAALWVNYRVYLQPVHILPSWIAQHPHNRNGAAVNGQRVDELLRKGSGHCDPEEASFGAVAVQEKPGLTFLCEYNKTKTQGEDKLQDIADEDILQCNVWYSMKEPTRAPQFWLLRLKGPNFQLHSCARSLRLSCPWDLWLFGASLIESPLPKSSLPTPLAASFVAIAVVLHLMVARVPSRARATTSPGSTSSWVSSLVSS